EDCPAGAYGDRGDIRRQGVDQEGGIRAAADGKHAIAALVCVARAVVGDHARTDRGEAGSLDQVASRARAAGGVTVAENEHSQRSRLQTLAVGVLLDE